MFNVVRFARVGNRGVALVFRARPWRWPLRRPGQAVVRGALLAVPGYNIPVAFGAQTVPAGELGLLIATEPVFIVAFILLLSAVVWPRPVIGGGGLALSGFT